MIWGPHPLRSVSQRPLADLQREGRAPCPDCNFVWILYPTERCGAPGEVLQIAHRLHSSLESWCTLVREGMARDAQMDRAMEGAVNRSKARELVALMKPR